MATERNCDRGPGKQWSGVEGVCTWRCFSSRRKWLPCGSKQALGQAQVCNATKGGVIRGLLGEYSVSGRPG